MGPMSEWPNLFKVVISGNHNEKQLKDNILDMHKETYLYSSILHFAVTGGNIKTIEYLIKHNADVNASNGFAETPLHWCCKEGSFEIAKLLIEYGANILAIDNDGNLPIHWAAEYGQCKIVSLLLSLGSPYNTLNNDLETPLELAIINSANETVSTIFSYIANQPYKKKINK